MLNKWNQFVYVLHDAKNRGVNEDSYHTMIENQLQFLGWLLYKGEICHKPNVPIGNSNFIQPDILVKKDGENQFVIEVKRPIHVQTERERIQLESYMRQLKINVGIYIGEHIEVFYDTPKRKDAVSVMKVPLELDNKMGAKFVEIFSKENFNKESIVAFCEERRTELQKLEKLNEIKKNIIADAQTHIAKGLELYLLNKYDGTFSEEDIKGMLGTLRFTAKDKEVANTEIPVSIATPQPSYYYETMGGQYENKRDSSKYSLNGGPFLGKNRFVHAVVSTYLKQNPDKTFREIEEIFRPEMQGSMGVIKTINDIRSKEYKGGRRFFDRSDEILYTGDGIPFAVSTQWKASNISNIVRLAEELGYIVDKRES